MKRLNQPDLSKLTRAVSGRTGTPEAQPRPLEREEIKRKAELLKSISAVVPERAGYKVIGFFSTDDPGYNKYKKSCKELIKRNAEDLFKGIDPERLSALVTEPMVQAMAETQNKYPVLWAIDKKSDTVIGQMMGALPLKLRSNERSWLRGSYDILVKHLLGPDSFRKGIKQDEILAGSGIVVDRERRGQGIASNLMRIMIDYIKKQGAKIFAVTNEVTNRASEKLINSLEAWMPLKSGLTKDYPQGAEIPDYDSAWCFDTKQPITNTPVKIVTRVIELN